MFFFDALRLGRRSLQLMMREQTSVWRCTCVMLSLMQFTDVIVLSVHFFPTFQNLGLTKLWIAFMMEKSYTDFQFTKFHSKTLSFLHAFTCYVTSSRWELVSFWLHPAIPTAAVSGRRHHRSSDVNRCSLLENVRFRWLENARTQNSLPPDVISAPTLTVFQNRLKTYLFSRSFPSELLTVSSSVHRV